MIKIKQTKSISMNGDEDGVSILVESNGQNIWIPAKVTHQVLRGLISYQQKFYRKHVKKV